MDVVPTDVLLILKHAALVMVLEQGLLVAA
jgi:hypothetical protein